MKKIISAVIMGVFCISLTACGSEKEVRNAETASSAAVSETTETVSSEDQEKESESAENSTLVAYFSATGNTKAIAEIIADGLQADLYEIVPAEPYTDADLNYNDSNSRCTQEKNDSSARPEISGMVENFEQYTTIYLGYPLWWGEAPRILDTFVETYDFTGKTVIPFCTSASSGIGDSGKLLEEMAGTGDWQEGKRFSSQASEEEVLDWGKSFAARIH